ncbi:thiamine-phosphate kinase [Salinimonas sp. HHU 13199]|uniref:Thiamine-monophosphate kinase n=1 Tax=Salinimonas profundi TaxID=2729140 RepID=A0ABR8LQI4_9ALTE|nr:thiamine-phosphate kinase [Salinimonas profundi]MBD3587331.1 thiamine-phosphate kinase [Salinimonas profundi]
MKEFDLIGRYFVDGGYQRKDVVVGIGDDCAVTTVASHQQLAITTDTLVAGVHFLKDAPAKSVAYKAVAVNLSDLAAMGAEPAWISLSLSISDVDEAWMVDFADGMYELTRYYSVQLIGGDTVRGPLSMTITAQGFIPPDNALKRSTAKPGDWIYVTGHLGDAAAGLDILTHKLDAGDGVKEYLVNRHLFPTPRVAAGTSLRRVASSCIDVSDGFLSDLKHILRASGCGAVVQVDKLPVSSQLRDTVALQQAIDYALTGGDDYELIFTVNEEQRGNLETALASTGIKITCVGQITGQENKIDLKDHKDKYPMPEVTGFEHQL